MRLGSCFKSPDGNSQLFREQPLAGFRDHQVNARDARVGFEQ